jgi:hypothetical protein
VRIGFTLSDRASILKLEELNYGETKAAIQLILTENLLPVHCKGKLLNTAYEKYSYF